MPTTVAPRIATLLLGLPLMAMPAACTESKPKVEQPQPTPEPAYGGPEMVDPLPPDNGGNTPTPKQPDVADPKPAEPQGEIYGSPQMMDPEGEAKPEPPPEPAYGGPAMDEPSPTPND